MKSKIYSPVLILILLLSGCVPASREPQPATVTPNIAPRLDPSPTPSGSTLPKTCQVTDLNVYINKMDGYCFAYPARFTLGDQPSDKPDVHGPAIGSGEPISATFSMEVTPTLEGQTVREQAEAFLKHFSGADPATFTWTEVQVGGEAGWKVEPIPVQLAWRIVFVQHHGRMYRLSYWPVDVPEASQDLDDLTQTTLGSFAFLE